MWYEEDFWPRFQLSQHIDIHVIWYVVKKILSLNLCAEQPLILIIHTFAKNFYYLIMQEPLLF